MSGQTSERPRRGVRSYVRREGRITAAQQRALAELWERYGCPSCDEPLDLDRLFGRPAPRHLEIGCGNGDFLLAAAQAHPENDYLGIEVHRPGLGSLLLRAQAADLRNLHILNRDAAEALAAQLPEDAFECAYLFFPDPWPKKRHHKRRLIQTDFAQRLQTRLRPHGRLFIATDWEDYALHIVEVMGAQDRLVNLAGAAIWAPRPKLRPLTRYENRALRLGHTIRDLIYGRIA